MDSTTMKAGTILPGLCARNSDGSLPTTVGNAIAAVALHLDGADALSVARLLSEVRQSGVDLTSDCDLD